MDLRLDNTHTRYTLHVHLIKHPSVTLGTILYINLVIFTKKNNGQGHFTQERFTLAQSSKFNPSWQKDHEATVQIEFRDWKQRNQVSYSLSPSSKKLLFVIDSYHNRTLQATKMWSCKTKSQWIQQHSSLLHIRLRTI